MGWFDFKLAIYSAASRKHAQRPWARKQLTFEILEDRRVLSAYQFDLVAETGRNGITSIEPAASMNDAGNVAFVASNSGGQGIYFYNSTGLTEVATDSSFSYGRELQLNNSDQIGAVRNRGGTRTARIWNTATPDNSVEIAGSSTMIPNGDLFIGLGDSASISNDGKLAFAGLVDPVSGADYWEVHLSDSPVAEGSSSKRVTSFSGEPSNLLFRQMAADDGSVVIGVRGTESEILLDTVGGAATTIATTADGHWNNLGLRPGISDDGYFVTFSGADAAGAGNFLYSVVTGATVRIAGVAGNGILDPGETFVDANGNGTFDPGASEIDSGPFASFSMDTRVGVNGSHGSYDVVFIANGTDGKQGLYDTQITVSPTGGLSSVESSLVGEAGDNINGFAIQTFGVYDPINSDGQIAFAVGNGTTQAIIRATPPRSDLKAANLKWNSQNGGTIATYEVSDETIGSDTNVGLYWASGTTFNQAIGSPITTQPIPGGTTPGTYQFEVPGSMLQNAPPGTTNLLLVVDPPDATHPRGHVAETVETNNVENLALPDIAVVTNDASGVPTNFFWNPLANGGGFTFTYRVNNPGDQPLPDSEINFYWQSPLGFTNTLAYEFTLDSAAVDSEGNSATDDGVHQIVVTQHEMLSQYLTDPSLGTSPSPPDPSPGNIPVSPSADLLSAVIDPADGGHPSGRILETDETNNQYAISVVPLVVEVVSPGFNPLPEITSPQSFLAPFVSLALTLQDIPSAGSTLDNRVASYVSTWDSTKSFRTGFLDVMLANLEQAEVAQGSIDPTIGAQQIAAFISKAQTSALASDFYLYDAAVTIVNDLTSQDSQFPFLLPPDQSNQLQTIELVGHSRGAELNAMVARLLKKEGYNNIANYTSLDGYSQDWSTQTPSSGVLTDFNIGTLLNAVPVSNALLNIRAGQGMAFDNSVITFLLPYAEAYLASTNVNPLIPFAHASTLAWLQTFTDLRAPNRSQFGFTDSEFPGTTHTTITTQFGNALQVFDSPVSNFIALDYIYQNQLAGFDAPAAVRAASNNEQPVQSLSPLSQDVHPLSGNLPTVIPNLTGFVDGTIERLGAAELESQNTPTTPTGDPVIDTGLQILNNPANLIGLYWDTTGDVRLAQTASNTALELHHPLSGVASVAQTIVLPDRAQSIEFDLGVQSPMAGDTLDVLVDGNIVQSIDLTTASANGHQSIALPAGVGTTGTFTFQLAGQNSSPGNVTLDNLAIGVIPNHAPVVLHNPVTLPTVSRTISDAANMGIVASSLQSDLSDADSADVPGLGIAIVGADSAHGTLQYSTNNGASWSDVNSVADSNALLLSPDATNRIRFVPNVAFTGPIGSVVTFRVWDRTTGISGLSGEYFDATVSGGTSAFSANTDSGSIDITNNVPGEYSRNDIVDAADYTVWRDTLGSTMDLRADGSHNNTVDQTDYEVWKTHFGETVAVTLVGDYNANGIVDAADYPVWRDTLGSTANLRADGSRNGVVDQADYDVWKSHFGETMALGPTAVDDHAYTSVGLPVTIGALSNDSSSSGTLVLSSVAVAQPPAHGSVKLVSATGELVYTPNPGFVGDDLFRYTVNDNQGHESNVATVVVSVQPFNTLLGDLNGDSSLSDADLEAFDIYILSPTAIFPADYPNVDPLIVGDLNGDHVTNSLDRPLLVQLLTSKYRPDRFEPNDSFETAKDLGTVDARTESQLTVHLPANNDYYQFLAAKTGPTQIQLLFSHADGDLDLFVYDVAHQQIASSESLRDNESVTLDLQAGQRYFVRVAPKPGVTQPRYDLVISDVTPPSIVAIDPADHAIRPAGLQSIRVEFSEPIQAASASDSVFQLKSQPNGNIVPISVQQADGGRTVLLTFAPLSAGSYELDINASQVRDLSETPLGAQPIVSDFTTVAAAIQWMNPAGGSWHDPNNWLQHRVPGPGDDVLINVPGDVTITFNQGSTTIHSLYSANSFALTGGTLGVTTFVQVDGAFTLGGGATLVGATLRPGVSGAQAELIQSSAVFDGVTLDGDLLVEHEATLTVRNGLTVNGTLTVRKRDGDKMIDPFFDCRIVLEGDQQLHGSGDIYMDGAVGWSRVNIQQTSGTLLSIDSGLTIHGKGYGLIAHDSLTNNGTILFDAGWYDNELNATSVSNNGVLGSDTGGGILVLRAPQITNSGSIETRGPASFHLTPQVLPVPGVLMPVEAAKSSSIRLGFGRAVVSFGLLKTPKSRCKVPIAWVEPRSTGEVERSFRTASGTIEIQRRR